MSTLMPSSAIVRNKRAAMPARSVTPCTVTLPSETSCVTPEMIAFSIRSSSSLTKVPAASEKLDATRMITP